MLSKAIRTKLYVASALSAGLLLTSCAMPPQSGGNIVSYNFNEAFNNPDACSDNARNRGIAVGIATGALIGFLIKKNAVAALEGAAAGGVAGAAVGSYVDHRRCEAYKIAMANGLEIASATVNNSEPGGAEKAIGTDMIIQNEGLFEPGSSALMPNAQSGLPQIAQQYNPERIDASEGQGAASQHVVLITSRESQTPNIADPAALSTQRAATIAKAMVEAGVPAQNIYVQGAGNSQSIVPTSDPSASGINNSIQIRDFPSVQSMKAAISKNIDNPPAAVVAPNTAAIVAPNTVSPPIIAPEAGATLSATNETEDSSYDFGGKPVTGAPEMIALGPSQGVPGFALISSAFASTPVTVKACVLDHPRQTNPIVNYATGQELPISQAMPGFYGAPWEGGYNGNLIAVLHVYVPRDSGGAVPQPIVEIYKNYKNGDETPNYHEFVPVNVYRSQDKTLYRLFVGGPAKCLDLVVDNGIPQGKGKVFYNHDGQLYAASGLMALQN